MTASVEHVTIATSSGAVWLALILHFGAGLVALVTGFVAISVAKGGRAHRKAGIVFVVAMITAGIFAAGIAAYEGKIALVVGGMLTAYLVFTGFTTVRPVAEPNRHGVNVALTIVGFSVALSELSLGFIGLNRPNRMIDGVAAPMILFMGTVALLAAIGDWRLVRAGGIHGAHRLARHLWRMCFGLFIASGSFFFGQMKFLPEALRILPLLAALGVAPLVVLLYWMWRVRLRQKLHGMEIRKRIEAGSAA